MKKIIDNNSAWIDEIWTKIDKKLSRTAILSRNKIPYTTINGKHDNRFESDSIWWTNGFWGGLMWLMYIGTKNNEYKLTAEVSEKILDKAMFDKFEYLHHDVGFMWHILSGVNYRITGNTKSKTRNLIAASVLSSRYHLNGEFIQAWNSWGDENHDGWSIIDCMMNIPLLYWATEETGSLRFKQIAISHADMTMRDHIRPDGSVKHIVSHDPVTGEVIENFKGQGYDVNSSWSRGQAWAIYGFILSYIHTGKQEYLDTAKKVAQYFISCVCSTDYLPLCDFRAPEEPIIYDSTAGACAACGLIEIANNVPEYEKKTYINAAINILKAMEKKFCNWDENEDSILQMGTGAYFCDKNDRHIPIIYGDYFFTEAIYKLKGFDFLPW